MVMVWPALTSGGTGWYDTSTVVVDCDEVH